MNIKVDNSKVERHSLFESKISTNLPGTVAPWVSLFCSFSTGFQARSNNELAEDYE